MVYRGPANPLRTVRGFFKVFQRQLSLTGPLDFRISRVHKCIWKRSGYSELPIAREGCLIGINAFLHDCFESPVESCRHMCPETKRSQG